MINSSFKTLLVCSLLSCLLSACGGGNPSAQIQAELPTPVQMTPPSDEAKPEVVSVPMPSAQTFRKVTYPYGRLADFVVGNGIYVATAKGGVVTSRDGYVWTLSPTFSEENLYHVLFTGSGFVAFGDGGTVFNSPNGTDWSVIASGLPYLRNVIHTGTRFIAQTQDDIMSSEDGVVWKSLGLASGSIHIVNDKLFILADQSIFMSLDGLTWSRIDKPAAAGIRAPKTISYGNGIYVLLVSDQGFFYSSTIPQGSQIYTSTDGKEWTQRYTSDSEILLNMSFVHGTFITTGLKGKIRTSTDGITWTERVSGTSESERSGTPFYFNDRFFIPSSGGFITSKDGVSWTRLGDSDVTQSLISVQESNGRLFLLAGDRIGVSSDGASWKFAEPTYAQFWAKSDILYANGLFVAVGGGLSLHITSPAPGDRTPKGWILTSTDAVHWTLRTLGANLSLQSVTYGNGRFVAVGGRSVDNSASTVMTSEDGIQWTRAQAPTNTMLEKVIYAGGQFMATGNDLVKIGTDPIMQFCGSLIGSPDGLNWSTRLPPFRGEAHGISYGNNHYVMTATLQNEAGDYQSVTHTSADGMAWSASMPPYSLFAGVAFSNGVFVSGGGTDLVSSRDGKQWDRHPVGDVFLSQIEAQGGNFIAFFATDMWRLYMTSNDGAQWTTHQMHQFGYGGMVRATYGRGTWLMPFDGGIYISPYYLMSDNRYVTR
jgi:hypothetical protein